jgi:hypothetical protein
MPLEWVNFLILTRINFDILGPNRAEISFHDMITWTHGMISSNFVDAGQHILGDSGNNSGYSGGLVIGVRGYGLLGLVTKRSCKCNYLLFNWEFVRF